MADTTPRFALPLLAPGQAQKEMFHNEALALADLLLHASVVATGLDAPPPSPAAGACWIVGATPTGAWAGHPRAIAGWTDGGWRFVAPRAGMRAWDTATARALRYDGGAWGPGTLHGDSLVLGGATLLAAPAAAIATPSGGATIDAEARTALAAVLAALRHHGLIGVA